MKANYTEKDQIWNQETTTTRFWFDVEFDENTEDNGQYAAADCAGEITYLDSDGCEVDQSLVPKLEGLIVITQEMIDEQSKPGVSPVYLVWQPGTDEIAIFQVKAREGTEQEKR